MTEPAGEISRGTDYLHGFKVLLHKILTDYRGKTWKARPESHDPSDNASHRTKVPSERMEGEPKTLPVVVLLKNA